MSKELGGTLPNDLMDFLSQTEPEEKFKQVIIFNTVDDDGWPRHGLLSPREVVGKDAKRILLLLYKESKSTANVHHTGKISLIVITPSMSYYVYCNARSLPSLPDAPHETLFELTVEKVVEDSFPTAKILSGITFEGYDPGMTQNDRKIIFERLIEM